MSYTSKDGEVRITVLAAVLACAIVTLTPAPAAPGARKGLDLARIDALLSAVVRDGRADYKRLILLSDELSACVRWIETTRMAPSWSAEERLAFWINAYNVLVLKAVADRYPIASVRDVTGFFDSVPHRAAGQEMTLNELEKDRIRKASRDPRVHFALVCASTSCPELMPGAFWPATLQADLDRRTRAFLADTTRGLVVDERQRVVRYSQIFEWYKSDFEAKAGSVVAFVDPYLAPGPREALKAAGGYRFEPLPYDWQLNDVDRAAKQPLRLWGPAVLPSPR